MGGKDYDELPVSFFSLFLVCWLVYKCGGGWEGGVGDGN